MSNPDAAIRRVELLTEFIEAVQAEERERCCKVLCRHCERGKPLERYRSGKWWHVDGKWMMPCAAAVLRVLPLDES